MRKACLRDMNFIWLLNGAEAPSDHEIARFRSQRLSQCAEELSCQMVKKLKEYGEFEYERLFVDGTKIEANANKYSFVWKKSTNKYEARLDAKVERLLPELCNKHRVLTNSLEELLHFRFATAPRCLRILSKQA